MSEYGEPWTYDERVRCVAVYNGPDRNCLSLPRVSFISSHVWGEDQYADPSYAEAIENRKAQLARAVACVNALEGCDPEKLGALLEACATHEKRWNALCGADSSMEDGIALQQSDEALIAAYRALRGEE